MKKPSLTTTLQYHLLAIVAVAVVLYWEGMEKWDRWVRRNVIDEEPDQLTDEQIDQILDEEYVNRYLASIEPTMRQLR